MISIKGFHLELTNKCYLKCSQCSRTTFINKFGIKNWKNIDINFEYLKNFFDIDLNSININFCGLTGDPIYHPQFLEIVSYFKDKNANVEIHTNGSYKNVSWWKELSTILDTSDSIIFGIDGLPTTFTEYRKNADWESIRIGIDTMVSSKAKTIWQCILFNFNENQINEIKKFAYSLGIDEFMIIKSTRWDDDSSIRPTDNNINLLKYNSINDWKFNKSVIEVNPRCLKNQKEHYITADGFYTPCCNIAEYRFYYKTDFYKHKNLLDISKTTITKILNENKIINFYNNIQELKLPVCTYSCPKV